MKVRILGPFDVMVNGTSILPTAGKPRQILALLSLHAGSMVSMPTLMDELWGAEPPQSALTTLQTYVSQLRRRLDAAPGPDTPRPARDVLVTCQGGYVLRIPPTAVDVHAHEQFVTAGHAAFEDGRDESAAASYHAALALWQGPALGGVPCGRILGMERRRLEVARLVAVERRIDVDLRLGRHNELLAELAGLVTHHPLHEGLHSQAMVALYRSGRRAAAIGVYRRLRRLLVGRLGVEPAPQLQRLHQAILTVDPALNVAAGPRHTPTFDLYPA
ncbi:AfsR/SARP family transcriptional regulator [Streptomyces sp. IBSBF 2953]|uniref:AfsR/SARP family transcriptional regulator n=1 Tax=Streptomyces TaxID=1883 RepID=UPI002119FEC3|nr:AfsR/SARP family transcriptional regulator [Streptomyces scabiei]MCQ9184088.1 AfsR/SARP family transcriptional regulator [Streptomyces hayashii]MDX3117020.1 AfsR/SARP family transcriptional regulator [Streptomyces scabiei]